jgi:hypothetical protein
LRRNGSARVIEESTTLANSAEDAGLYPRPNGSYWATCDRHQEFGPFAMRALALADRDRFDQQGFDSIETLQAVERGAGPSDWIDIETGLVIDGESPPPMGER